MLKEFICLLKDPRRAAGTRYSFESMMTLIILGTCMGYVGYRELHRFVKNNRDYLIPELGLTHGIPSHNTIRRLLQQLKSEDVLAAFNEWARRYYPIVANTSLATDGQALRATVTDHDNEAQNFVTVVSLFATQTGITHALAAYKKQETTEYHTAAELLGLFLSAETPILQQADALHAKKNA
jgi:DDE_Tnp_1-associated